MPKHHVEQRQVVVDNVEPKAPYFNYRDHAHIMDPDPSKPVTIPGRIPTFTREVVCYSITSRSGGYYKLDATWPIMEVT